MPEARLSFAEAVKKQHNFEKVETPEATVIIPSEVLARGECLRTQKIGHTAYDPRPLFSGQS